MLKPLKRSIKLQVAGFLNFLVEQFELRSFLFERVIRTELQRFDTHRIILAVAESSHYAEEHMAEAKLLPSKEAVIKFALEQVKLDGLYLEFGVYSGGTANLIASYTKGTVHGFDSFQGLPEDWIGDYRKGTFDLAGKLPRVKPNVKLHVGWFDQTLPQFVQDYTDDIAFLHVDCDLYSSTKTIFAFLGDRLKPGSVIVFDEYFNYPSWQEHEYKAFQELVAEKHLTYRYLCYSDSFGNAAVMIESKN